MEKQKVAQLTEAELGVLMRLQAKKDMVRFKQESKKWQYGASDDPHLIRQRSYYRKKNT